MDRQFGDDLEHRTRSFANQEDLGLCLRPSAQLDR
jgi:hypothetical protein